MKTYLSLFPVAIITAALSSSALAHPHLDPGANSAGEKASKVQAGDHTASSDHTIVSGGYQYMPHKLKLPKEIKLKHAHGLARDKEDNIYLAYESRKIEENTHAIAVFNKAGEFTHYIGGAELAHGEPHGLDLVYEEGEKFLYLSSNGQIVRKINLQGKVVWESAKHPDHEIYIKGGKYKPTDTASSPDKSTLYVADGYGSSTITTRQSDTGSYTGKLWRGGEKEGLMKTPHGVTYDSRVNRLAVSDRGNARILYYNLDGIYQSQIKGQGISEVCNTDVWGDYLLVPNLDGSVAYLDKNNQHAGTISISDVLGEQGHKHPHDAIFLSNGDVVIGTWNPGRLSYWKRLPTAK